MIIVSMSDDDVLDLSGVQAQFFEARYQHIASLIGTIKRIH